MSCVLHRPLKNARIIDMHRINKTLVYFLIFTIISSGLAFHIVVKAYDSFDYIDTLNYYAK